MRFAICIVAVALMRELAPKAVKEMPMSVGLMLGLAIGLAGLQDVLSVMEMLGRLK